MVQPVIQTAFSSGEWSPSLNARVDLKQYRYGAAKVRNFFVDYRGGVTKSPGTDYVLRTRNLGARLIPFQASFSVNYAIEFGSGYLRFFNNGAPVLEGAVAITAISQANPGVVTAPGHGLFNGDWVYIIQVVGMTQVNGQYYIVSGVAGNNFQLNDIFGTPINTTTFNAYVSGGTVARVLTIASPYTTADLPQIKYAQDVNIMILCHPNYPPYQLVFTSATSWALTAIVFGSTVSAPVGQSVSTTLAAGSVNYAYVITAVDANGQESAPSAYATLASIQDLRTTAGTNTITWTPVAGAASYNVYKASLRYGSAVPAGSMFGWIGNCTAATFIDSNISPDFSQNYPIVVNPFFGSGVQSITLTNQGANYTAVPSVSLTAPPGGGVQAFAQCALEAASVTVFSGGQSRNPPPSQLSISVPGGQNVILNISAGFDGVNYFITGATIANRGKLLSGSVPANPQPGWGWSITGFYPYFNLTWRVTDLALTTGGAGYLVAPSVNFTGGGGGSGAAGTTALGAPSAGNPTVPTFYQQRLVLAGPISNPRQLNMSQPGTYFNYNVTAPIQPDNAFQGYLVSGQLNTIQSMISQPQGLAVLSDQSAWLVNGGSPGSPADATNMAANPQVFSGAAGPPPLVAGEDILYVQSKGSIVRNMSFNWNKQIYGGKDISAISSHLFYGYKILEWAWAEEPFKVAWAVRNDGTMLSLTYLAEQELIAWSTRDTQGKFKSVCAITETSPSIGAVNAVYCIVERTVAGSGTVQYIERFTEQYYANGASDAWNVDAGAQYGGSPQLTFSGVVHLAGQVCTGLATDDTGNVTVFTTTVSITGTFTLPAPPSPATGYTRVTVGLGYTAQLQTLGIDTGDPTIQGKMKLIPNVTVRVKDTLGLSIGTSFDTLVTMDDLVIGNVGKDTNQIVTTAMVTGDAVQALDPLWQVPGQYCIQSSDPWPATILGLIPQITVEGGK